MELRIFANAFYGLDGTVFDGACRLLPAFPFLRVMTAIANCRCIREESVRLGMVARAFHSARLRGIFAMNTHSRRKWMLAAAVASCSAVPVLADSPQPQLRIAATNLPVTSRSIRLTDPRETRTVVTAIAADPRGELLAAAGDDQQIRILQASTLKTLHTLSGHRDLIRTLAFDSEGNRLVSAGNDGQLILWDRDESFKIEKIWSGTPALARVCFRPDGLEMAAVGFDSKVHIIGNRSRANFRCDCKDLRAVAFRDDMRMLAVAGRSGELHLFDPSTGDLLNEQPLHRGRITDLAFQSDSNQVICVGEDGRTTVFDSDRQKLVHEIPVTTSKLFTVAVINSELAAVAGSDNVIRIVNTDSGKVVRTLQGHSGSVSTLDSTGGWLFSGSFDATLRRWAISDISSSEQRIAEVDPRIDR